ILPLALEHGTQECIGYRIKDVAYITDCQRIPSSSLNALRGLEILVLDCLRIKPHSTHLHLAAALEIAAELQAATTVLTHLGHDLDYEEWEKKLPPGVVMAYDGLTLGRNEP